MKNFTKFSKSKFGQIILLIFIFAILIKLIYAIKLPYNVNQHDIEPNGNGLTYILTILEDHTLPDSNNGQFYHPPFNQFLCAIWLGIISLFTTNSILGFESLQILTTIYSVILIFVSYKICKELHFTKISTVLVTLIMAFFPYMTILSSSINNDLLCFLMMLTSLYFLIKWYRKTNIKNTTLLAIFTGLSVMTKSSGALIAFPISYIFILKFYRYYLKYKGDVKKEVNNFKRFFWNYCYFGAISLPIGLWYNVRNLLKFNQPILYVFDTHNSLLYTGDHSIVERFFSINFSELKKLYCAPFDDFNIPTYLLKCSLFGEYTFSNNLPLYIIALIFNFLFMILIIASIIFIIKSIIKKYKRNIEWKIAFLILFIINWISYLKMNVSLPYGCSMDFRYLEVTIFTNAMFIGFLLNTKKNNKILFYIISIIIEILLIASNLLIITKNYNGPL